MFNSSAVAVSVNATNPSPAMSASQFFFTLDALRSEKMLLQVIKQKKSTPVPDAMLCGRSSEYFRARDVLSTRVVSVFLSLKDRGRFARELPAKLYLGRLITQPNTTHRAGIQGINWLRPRRFPT
jgi:hypothetical protein